MTDRSANNHAMKTPFTQAAAAQRKPKAPSTPRTSSKREGGASANQPSRQQAEARKARQLEQEQWQKVLSTVKGQHPEIWRQWFEDIELMGIAGGTYMLRVSSDIHRGYLQRECAEQFDDAVRLITGHLLSVRFVGDQDQMAAAGAHDDDEFIVEPVPAAPPQPTPAPGTQSPSSATGTPTAPAGAHQPTPAPPVGSAFASVGPAPHPQGNHQAPASASASLPAISQQAFTPSRQHVEPTLERLTINPDYTLEHFVVGPENRLAHAACIAVAQQPGAAYNPLFIHGGVGLGKTHLLQSVCLSFIHERGPDFKFEYISCDAFITTYMHAVQSGQMQTFRDRFRHLDCIVIDDIHFLTKRESSQEEFFHTFNALYQGGKQIILSSDAAPGDIPDLEARLVSRFQSGLVVPVNPTCYETRVEIIKKKAAMRGVDCPEDVACFVAAKITSNIRELEGALTSIQAYAAADQQPVSLRLAKAALGDAEDEVRPEPTISDIVDAITDHYGVTLTQLQSKRKQKSIAFPRQVCMYLTRTHTRYSLEEVGGYFGGRDHTTVMHAVRTITKRRREDPEFASVAGALERALGVAAPEEFQGPLP